LTALLHIPGNPSLERQGEVARAAAVVALKVRGVRAVYGLTSPLGEVALFLSTVPEGPDPRPALRAALARIRGVTVQLGGLRSPLLSWPGEGMQIVARVSGADAEQVRKMAASLQRWLGKRKGVVDLGQTGFLLPQPQPYIELDREKIAKLGLALSDINQLLQVALGKVEVPDPGRPGKKAVVVLAGKIGKKATADLLKLQLRNSSGKMVRLGEVATMREVPEPAVVYREDGRPCLVVSCNVEGREVEAVRALVRTLAKELSLAGVSIEVD
jgi:multidrug efflux pump subunit AcrB